MTTEELPLAPAASDVTDVFEVLEQKVLWLATMMIHHANRVRPNESGMKVGGHQASSASTVSLLTYLWFYHLRPEDRVSVKPHASPVLHSINYLIGCLDEASMPTLRQFGGLQSYPSRSKDPDPVDYSTGSVGIGATAPVWGAVAKRYLASHWPGGPSGRQYSLVGDAELDEGACWEAILDPMVAELGEVVWIVDVNRQSLDRVVPNIGIERLQRMFDGAGWQVLSAKYGRRLRSLFARHGGPALQRRLDDMSNSEYQRLLRCPPVELTARLPGRGSDCEAIAQLVSQVDPAELHRALRNLGGHDADELSEAFARIDDTRPTVIFAYTIKGYLLPVEGHPQNHSALLTDDQLASLAAELGADLDHPWATFPPGSAAALRCSQVARRLARPILSAREALEVPLDLGRTPRGIGTTQAALGRTLVDLSRAAPATAGRIVTVSPDVSSSTNLGGWINKVGIWSPAERPDWFSDDSETILHWREHPLGQHIELGIAETNMVGLLGELGATWSRWGEALIPIGVMYDPFVERALEPWSFSIYSGGQSILVGTPSGVSLAAEGGAHQSIKTPSIGLEQPGCVSYEPAFVIEAEWTLLDAMSRLGRPDGSSTYLRLSTRPVDQALANIPADPAARDHRRKQVVAGAYTLRRTSGPDLTICTMGAVTLNALDAASRLEAQGIATDVVCVTSPGLLFRAVQARRGLGIQPIWILESVFPGSRKAPMVTVVDGHPHSLAFLAGINQVPATHLGVSGFGQSGDLDSVYRHHGLDADAIVKAALGLLR